RLRYGTRCGCELSRPGANLGAFVLPRRMTPKVKVIGRQSRGCVALIFDLDQHLVSRYWFTAERARLSAPRCAEGAVRLAARQVCTPNRVTGFLSEESLVRHERFLVIGPKRRITPVSTVAPTRRCAPRETRWTASAD